MPKKPSRKTLKNKLDKIFSQVVRERGACERCGNTRTLQTSHIYSRSNLSVRWDLDNAYCFCAACHFFWHKNPLEAAEFVRQYSGGMKYQSLKKRANKVKKWTDQELNELYLSLTRVKING